MFVGCGSGYNFHDIHIPGIHQGGERGEIDKVRSIPYLKAAAVAHTLDKSVMNAQEVDRRSARSHFMAGKATFDSLVGPNKMFTQTDRVDMIVLQVEFRRFRHITSTSLFH
jgi:hypothetical protein